MRKTLIAFIVAALAGPSSAAAHGSDPSDARLREAAIAQQPPPTPPRPRAPRVTMQGRSDAREEQRETSTKNVRIGGSGILDISNMVGNVEISRGGGNEAVIEFTKVARARTQEEARSLLPLVTVEINSRGERAEVRTHYAGADSMRRHRNVSVAVNFRIAVPPNTRITARTISGNLRATDIRGELSLVTTSGNVEIGNAARVTSAKSTSGNVELFNIDSDVALDAGTISGDVRVRSAKARRMEISTVSGKVTVQDVDTERLAAQTLSGDVEFAGSLASGGRYDLKSHSGNVRVQVLGGSGFEVEANSWSGTVHSEFAIAGADAERRQGRRKTIRGVVGDGSAVVNITTFSGNVYLVKK